MQTIIPFSQDHSSVLTHLFPLPYVHPYTYTQYL
jgi:hypothetical protein